MRHSVVILGAGPAGAGTALFLARRGIAVTILDRDSPPTSLSEEWVRAHASQTYQGHSFLALGTQILSEEVPDLVDRLVAMGACKVALEHSPTHWNLLARRRLLDAVMREEVAMHPNIKILSGVLATDLVVTNDPGSIPQVVGINTTAGILAADVLVDAGGWRSPVPHWLAARRISCDVQHDQNPFFYLTRHYRLKPGATFPSTRVPIIAALDYVSALAFPEDNGLFQLSLQLDSGDSLKRTLRNPTVFDRFLAEIPAMSAWIDAGEPVSDPQAFASVGNCRKRTFRDRPLVTGLLMVGDAAVHTNPSAARGVALALLHAKALVELLSSASSAVLDQAELSERWDTITSRLMEPWLQSQIRIDSERRDQVRSTLEGRSWEASSDLSRRLGAGLAALRDSALVGAAGERLFNMLCTPEDIYRDRELMRRVLRESRSGSIAANQIGPSRERFEQPMPGI